VHRPNSSTHSPQCNRSQTLHSVMTFVASPSYSLPQAEHTNPGSLIFHSFIGRRRKPKNKDTAGLPGKPVRALINRSPLCPGMSFVLAPSRTSQPATRHVQTVHAKNCALPVQSGARFELVFHILLPLACDLSAILPEINFAPTTQYSFNPPAQLFNLPRFGRDNFRPQQLSNLLGGQNWHGKLLPRCVDTGCCGYHPPVGDGPSSVL